MGFVDGSSSAGDDIFGKERSVAMVDGFLFVGGGLDGSPGRGGMDLCPEA